ncbi:hypothetical protein Tco_0661524 [Tanacetum coccineum]
MKRMTNPSVLHTSLVKDSSEIVNINISLNDLSEFSNEGDEDDKIASIDSSEVKSNGLEKNCNSNLGIENGCDGSTLMEMTTIVTKIKVSDLVNFANGVAGLKMDLESCKSPTAELFEVDSRKDSSIRHWEYKIVSLLNVLQILWKT